MDRRAFLAAVGVTVSLAGCTDGGGGPAPTTRSTPVATGTPNLNRAAQGIPPDICEGAIQSDPGIYAIDDPAFAPDWSGRDVDRIYRYDNDRPRLVAEQPVIGLTTGDRARAYPLEILWQHEVVNDTFGGPVVVTYCPLCRSAMVAERRVDGRATTFAVSGLLWTPERLLEANSERQGRVFGVERDGTETAVAHNGNLVLYDWATRSYWSQMLARAICGEKKGSLLTIRPSTVARWDEWRWEYPETDVLLPPPYSGILERNG